MNLIANPPDFISLDIETDGLNSDLEIFSLALAWKENEKIISIGSVLDRFSSGHSEVVEKMFFDFFQKTLFNTKFSGTFIFHNVFFDLPFLIRRFGLPHFSFEQIKCKNFCKIKDTQALSRTMKNNKFVSHIDPTMEKCHSLKFLAREYLGIDHHSFATTTSGRPIRFVDNTTVLNYNKMDAELTLSLYSKFEQTCQSSERDYFDEIEMPFNLIILELNSRGLPFRMESARQLSMKIYSELQRVKVEIYKAVGFTFNISSSKELGKALFNNSNLYLHNDDFYEKLRPLYLTEKQQIKVDLETLQKIKENVHRLNSEAKPIITTIENIILALELLQAYEDIEKLVRYAKRTSSGTYRLFPKIAVDAKTGRIRSGSPNVLGLSKKIFSYAVVPASWLKDDITSIRNLIGFESNDDDLLVSIDISGLDLGVISAGLLRFNPNTFWADCFKKYGQQNFYPDTHMAILSRVNPNEYQRLLLPIKSALKISSPSVDLLISKKTEEGIFHVYDRDSANSYDLPVNVLSKEHLIALFVTRSKMKTLNLAIPYNLGALNLARQLTDATGEWIGEFEAKNILANFHSKFPEIRELQDSLAEDVYRLGYSITKFGRKIYADCFDQLNESLRHTDSYEFVVCINGSYKLIEVSGWIKDAEPIFSELRIKKNRCVLEFNQINRIVDLSDEIFKKKRTPSFSKLARKSEQRQNDQLKFDATLFKISHDIDCQKQFQNGSDFQANEWYGLLKKSKSFVIPEQSVLFYRVKLKSLSSEFFLPYKPLLKVARPFFATFCQAEATIVAKKCTIDLVSRMEHKNISANLLLFIHDQFVWSCKKNEIDTIRKELIDEIESPKLLNSKFKVYYPTQFSGEFSINGNCFK